MPKLAERGFTIIELLIALVMGLLVLAVAVSFTVTTLRSVEGSQIREETHRNARFIAMSVERDAQMAGVGIESTNAFGTLAVQGDTLIVLSVPFDPLEAPVYAIDPGPGTTNPLPLGQPCGTDCISLIKQGGVVDIDVGDLARMEINGTRRLILVTARSDAGTSVNLTYTNHPTLLGYTAGLTGGLQYDRFSTVVQKLSPVVYYLQGQNLMRAAGFNTDGTLKGELIGEGVTSWTPGIIFVDGDILPEANVVDSDLTNDYDDLVGLQILATVAADRVHRDVNNGALFTKDYQWRVAPRNLSYERNRR